MHTKVNPVGRLLSEVERAYLAGLIDGDGAIMAHIEPHQEVKHILEMITPYLHGKHKQGVLAQKVLAHKVDTEKNLYQAACLADTLSKFNVRSRKRRKNFATMIQKVFPVTT